MSGARLQKIVDAYETLVVPIRLGIVFYEVQVHAVWKGQSVCISVCSIEVQICTSLTVIDLGPVARDSRDVIHLEDFLDAIYGAAAVDYGPVAGWDVEEFFDVDGWLHYNLQVF